MCDYICIHVYTDTVAVWGDISHGIHSEHDINLKATISGTILTLAELIIPSSTHCDVPLGMWRGTNSLFPPQHPWALFSK